MLEQKRLWGEGKTIERRVSLPPIVSAEGFTPVPCRHSWRHQVARIFDQAAKTPQKPVWAVQRPGPYSFVVRCEVTESVGREREVR